MKIIAQSGLRYIPVWHKNRKQPEPEQIVIEWNYLSGVDRELVFGFKPIIFNENGKVTQEYTLNIDNIELVKKSIKNIVNLVVEQAGETGVATAENICTLSELGGLYNELKTFFMTENSAEEKKN